MPFVRFTILVVVLLAIHRFTHNTFFALYCKRNIVSLLQQTNMTIDATINLEKLAAHLRTKRGDRGLRLIADEIGDVSASTLSRIEQGTSIPDLPTFIRLCSWLKASPDDFVGASYGLRRKTQSSDLPLPDSIEALLREDKVLPTSSVDAISEMIRVAYRAADITQSNRK